MARADLSDHVSQIKEILGLHDGHALGFITQNDQRIASIDVKDLSCLGRDDDLALIADRYHPKDVLASGWNAKTHVLTAFMVGQIIKRHS